MSRRVNVRAVVWRDGKILAVKHKASDGTESPYWATPGGGVDPQEPLEDAAKRELMEELGVAGSIKKLLFIQQFVTEREGFDEELEFLFEVEDGPAFDALDLESTTHGFSELSRVEFVDPKEVNILPEFLSTVDIEAYIKGNKPVLITHEFNK